MRSAKASPSSMAKQEKLAYLYANSTVVKSEDGVDSEQKSQSVFKGPRDKVSNLKVGSGLLFGLGSKKRTIEAVKLS